MNDKVKAVIEKAKGKKAKVKALKDAPTGTKAKKLPKATMDALTEAFPKAKFKDVRVHVGGNAADICKGFGAKAFAMGSDIYFAKPSDAKAPELLAHELTHVVQQAQGKVPKAQKGKALVSK